MHAKLPRNMYASTDASYFRNLPIIYKFVCSTRNHSSTETSVIIILLLQSQILHQYTLSSHGSGDEDIIQQIVNQILPAVDARLYRIICMLQVSISIREETIFSFQLAVVVISLLAQKPNFNQI